MGRNVHGLYKFSRDVSDVESSYGTNLKNPESSAKGIFQFTDATVDTAITRLIRILGYKPKEIANFQKKKSSRCENPLI